MVTDDHRPIYTLLFFCICFPFSITADTIIRDGGSNFESPGRTYVLGFFSPGTSQNRYLAIWFDNIPTLTAVWVANRATPIPDKSGVLNLTADGNLVLLNSTNDVVWSSNSTGTANTTSPFNVGLLDSGNLVVLSETSQTPLWQSFDYPCDTLLPGMNLSQKRYISSWTSANDPSPGDFSMRVDPDRYAQLVVRKGAVPVGFSGPWNGIGFSGTPGFRSNPNLKFNFAVNGTDMLYSYEPFNSSLITRFVINQTGESQRYLWNKGGWILYLSVTGDNCFRYALCGSFSSCNTLTMPICGCLRGFSPKTPKDWDQANWSEGCVRKTALQCSVDGFVKYSGVKLPDTLRSWHNSSMSIEACRSMCMMNCSCTAYANPDIREGASGCLIWFGDLVDIRHSLDNGQDVYIRMAASELDQGEPGDSSLKSRARVIIIVTVVGILLLCVSLALWLLQKKQQHQQKWKKGKLLHDTKKDDLELPLFEMATVIQATDHFSLQNKLGEGGFGSVYKGILKDGQEIAVKRLSKSSSQGLDEFKNEVIHIAKLQHRNLVKLLGCCIQENEMMLVYEYMPNNSLDTFIFDQTKGAILDWPKRFQIINGIARGLLYLHRDSRLRIIHRDIKASNVLLDKDMNPKISDFGLARSFGGNETEANTMRVVGTYGYMSPEYAIDGIYSTKSDVFSFGVMVLEIVCGKKNRGFVHSDHYLNLLGHAWKLHNEGTSLELIDTQLKESCTPHEVLRSIHLGLLCVQQYPEDRPNMSSVVLVLGSDSVLPSPKQPGFFMERDPNGADSSTSIVDSCSANNLTITMLDAR